MKGGMDKLIKTQHVIFARDVMRPLVKIDLHATRTLKSDSTIPISELKVLSHPKSQLQLLSFSSPNEND